MERNPTLVGLGSGTTHRFEQSRLLCGITGSPGRTIAEPPRVSLSPRKGLDLTLAPKGLKDSARGFNPWKRVNRAIRPEGAEDICERTSVWLASLHFRRRFYRPFRASFFLNQHLALKPQAQSFCPFGALTT